MRRRTTRRASLLAALRIFVGSRDLGTGVRDVVVDERVLGLHPLEGRDRVLTVPPGEAAKSSGRRRAALARAGARPRRHARRAAAVGRPPMSPASSAATYLRGVNWIAVPTTLTGQVDAAIGGKTGINTARGKEPRRRLPLPAGRIVIDTRFLATLPDAERRAGMAEVVKTGLLAGREVWKLEEDEMIRACAAFKAGVVLSDPFEREGRRTILNLGHTFAHALEAGSGYTRLPRRGGRPRPPRGAAPLRPRRPVWSRRSCDPSPSPPTRMRRGPRSSATRRARASSSFSRRPESRS